jgi:TolB protein
VDVETGDLQPVRLSHENFLLAGWSPDGESLFFCSDQDGDLDLYQIQLADGSVDQLTNALGHECSFEIAFSPDHTLMLFTYHTDEKSDIVMMDLETGYWSLLTNDPYVDSSPVWAPAAFDMLLQDTTEQLPEVTATLTPSN